MSSSAMVVGLGVYSAQSSRLDDVESWKIGHLIQKVKVSLYRSTIFALFAEKTHALTAVQKICF